VTSPENARACSRAVSTALRRFAADTVVSMEASLNGAVAFGAGVVHKDDAGGDLRAVSVMEGTLAAPVRVSSKFLNADRTAVL
jgi:hypothetical protein